MGGDCNIWNNHFIVDEVATRDDKYYVAKIAALDLHKIKITDAIPDVNDFIAISNDSDSEIAPLRNDLEAWARWAVRSERFTFMLLILSFIFTLVGPIIV